MPKGFTLVGYYRDNDQPYVGWSDAKTPEDAILRAMRNRPELSIIEVFRGKRKGILGNDEVINDTEQITVTQG